MMNNSRPTNHQIRATRRLEISGTRWCGRKTTAHGRYVMRIMLAFLVAAGLSLAVAQNTMAYGTPPGCPDCAYRRPITIPASSTCGDLSDFPVLISIQNDSNLTQAAGKVRNSNGYDIVFTNSSGSPLYHELESYDPDNGSVVAWVKIPTLSSSSDTVIYMYYGDSSVSSPTAVPEGVWDDNYVAVWHMKSDLTDSTQNGIDGTNSGTSNATGKMADARNFDGNYDYINLGSSTALQPSNLTFSFWVRRTTSWQGIVKNFNWFKGSSWDGNGWYVDCNDSGTGPNQPINLVVDGGNGFSITNIDPDTFYPYNTWVYITVTFNSSTNSGRAYKNAVSQTFSSWNSPSNISSTWNAKYLSTNAGGNTSLRGYMDEVRISDTVRSSCWIETEYNNQNNPSSFYVLGTEESLAPPPGCPTCGYRRKITIPKEDRCGDVFNFPVLISIQNDDDLKLVNHKVQSSSGYDIAFTDSDENPLYHDLELYDGNNGTVVAWVKVPTLSTSADTVIYMYYGDSSVSTARAVPEGVWTAGYRGVWHMNNIPGGSNDIEDSTSNAYHGTSIAMSGNQSDGKIGKALTFDGVNNAVAMPSTATGGLTRFSFSFWIKTTESGSGDGNFWNWPSLIGMDTSGAGSNDYAIATKYGYLSHWNGLNGSGDQSWTSSQRINNNAWHYVVGTNSGSGYNTIKLYLDGNHLSTGDLDSDGSGLVATYGFDIGANNFQGSPDDQHQGVFDEYHIANIARDACWIATEYANQNNPAGFYDIDPEEALGGHTITASVEAGSAAYGTISPTGSVTVAENSDKSFNITPDPGYRIKEVFVDTHDESGALVDHTTYKTYTFSNVTSDHLIIVSFEQVVGEFNWSTGDFLYRRQISVNSSMLPGTSCSTDLHTYPLLVKIDNDAELTYPNHVKNSQGYDIVFKLGDGTPLNFEVEKYDGSTGSLVAWVRIPTLAHDTDTILYMYYGNDAVTTPQGNGSWVWDFANYKGVWHLNESPNDDAAGGHADATSNGNDGTAMEFQDGGGGSTSVAGLMAGADRFVDDEDDRVVVADDADLRLPSDFTIETWAKVDSISSDQHLLYKQHSGYPYYSYQLYVSDNRQPTLVWRNSSSATTLTLPFPVDTGQWYYLVGVKDSGNLKIYLRGDGVRESASTSVSGTTYPANAALNIGGYKSGGTGLDGLMDEVRIASAPRSACWIDTSYNNMSNPGAYITVGSEEGQAATYTINSSAGAGGTISPLGTVTVAEGSSKMYHVTPSYGKQVDDVQVDNVSVSLDTNNDYTFSGDSIKNAPHPHTITVTFTDMPGDYTSEVSGTFGYRRPLVIDGTKLGDSCSLDLTNFPVLFHVDPDTHSELRSVGNSGNVQNDHGYDIVFKDAAGVLLPHELTKYDKLTGELTAWIKVPALTKNETRTIYMYYGNSDIDSPTESPHDVWDADFRGVWHFDETDIDGGSGDIKDSTSYNNDGTTSGMNAVDQVAGKIDGSFDFDGSNDYLTVPDDDSLDTADLTVEVWVKLANSANNQKIIGKTGLDKLSFVLGVTSNTPYPELWDNTAASDNSGWVGFNGYGTFSSNQWTHLAVTWKTNGNVVAYRNGSQVYSTPAKSNNLGANDHALIIGKPPWNTSYYWVDGTIDEIRISNTSRSACWIETEYSNQNNPGAFISLGDEESSGATFTITTQVVGGNGSISPAGPVTVAEGGSKTFILVPQDDNYQVDTVKIGDEAAQTWSLNQVTVSNVTQDITIQVTFKVAEQAVIDNEPEPGCSKNYSVTYSDSGGFDSSTLDVVNAELDDDKHIVLNTGYKAIDTENIVLPFRQQVSVYFLYEGGAFTHSDFGWMLADVNGDGVVDADDDPAAGTKHQIYGDVNDNNGNGVLDAGPTSTANLFGDVNGDGVVNALDNGKVLGTFDAGTELVFYLKIDDWPYSGPPLDYASAGDQVYFYTKTAWNQDKYHGDCVTEPLNKTYNLGLPRTAGGCAPTTNWMDADAIDRANDIFDLQFAANDTATLTIHQLQRFSHVIVGAPAEEPAAWVLGWEDWVGGGDTDHNDMVFIIERETGGTVALKSGNAIIPADSDDTNITGVTIGVWDYMPCDSSLNDIVYYLSIDAGEHWVEIDGWDEVWEFSLAENGRKLLTSEISDWTPGNPNYTYRKRRVDFAELGLGGRELLWRAELKSQKSGCEPKIIDMSLDMTVGVHGELSRSTPTVLANVLFSGAMETPNSDWNSNVLRGHLRSTRIYDPEDPSQTSELPLWDAGEVLQGMSLAARKIYMPKVDVHVVDVGSAEQLATGDGVTATFSGRLAHYPVLASTVEISDTHENFYDKHTDVLDGSQGGSGWINRFTGEYRISFGDPPTPGQPIKAIYSYFTYNAGNMDLFNHTNVTNAKLGIDDTEVIPNGYIYDFDNSEGVPDEDDGNWLVNWVTGYKDGTSSTTKKEWLLGAIDHSTAAVATPPAPGPWYYGTAFPYNDPNSENDRHGFDNYVDTYKDRPSAVYVGARDGMLHAFDAGEFRWGDNPCTPAGTDADKEQRGYFQWKNSADATDCITSCSDQCQPYYGTGEELWSFIPANLLPRLKNNYMQEADQSYVDASPALADVYVNNAWRTVLLAAEGNGGDTIFCLDVTNPSSPQFMWEFADPDLFRSRSSPSVAQIGRMYNAGSTRWVAFFVSGKSYDAGMYPSIYIVDIADGSVVDRVYLDADPSGVGGILSGQPTIVDSDGNGYVDRLYIGSDKGLLYKVNLPDDPDTEKYGITHCVVNTDFTDRDGNQVPDQWQTQAIYGSPAVVSSNSVDIYGHMTYDIRIFFGTGDSPYYDEDIDLDATRYFFYAYRDTSDKGTCDSSEVMLDWFYELPKGHRIYASAFAAAGNIYFGTSTGETEDPCDTTSNANSGVDPNAGKLYAFSLDNAENGPVLERVVGNVLSAPIVEDKHIYVQSAGGGVNSFGSGQYNSATRRGGVPKISINWWREMF